MTTATILVDLSRLDAAGTNGGIARFMHTLLPAVVRASRGRIRMTIILADAFSDPVEEQKLRPVAEVFPVSAVMADTRRFDVLYAAFGDSPFFEKARRSVSLIVDTLHRDMPEALPPEEVAVREAAFQRAVARATRLQCNSQFVVERMHACFGVPRDRMFTIANSIHRRLRGWRWPVRLRRPVLFYPANAWPHKNHETLFLAYRIYRSRVGSRAWDLELTGHADARVDELRRLAGTLGIEGHVHFLGYVPEAGFRRIWHRAGAMVFPSLYEGFGIPLLEAMHFGVPIVAHAGASVPEVAGDAALLVDARKPLVLADAMVRMTTDGTLRRRLRRAGRRRSKTFSLEREAKKLRDVFLALATE